MNAITLFLIIEDSISIPCSIIEYFEVSTTLFRSYDESTGLSEGTPIGIVTPLDRDRKWSWTREIRNCRTTWDRTTRTSSSTWNIYTVLVSYDFYIIDRIDSLIIIAERDIRLRIESHCHSEFETANRISCSSSYSETDSFFCDRSSLDNDRFISQTKCFCSHFSTGIDYCRKCTTSFFARYFRREYERIIITVRYYTNRSGIAGSTAYIWNFWCITCESLNLTGSEKIDIIVIVQWYSEGTTRSIVKGISERECTCIIPERITVRISYHEFLIFRRHTGCCGI